MTRLGLYGGPAQDYGAFSGKSEAVGAKPTDQIVRLGLTGTPVDLYGDFAPKAGATGGGKAEDQLTRLGLYGGPRFLYGDFSGKTEGEVVAPPQKLPGGYDKFHHPDPYLQIALREDEEMLMLMRAFIEVKKWH